MSGEQRGGDLGGFESAALLAGGDHVQELPGPVIGALGDQVARHLDQPGLDGAG